MLAFAGGCAAGRGRPRAGSRRLAAAARARAARRRFARCGGERERERERERDRERERVVCLCAAAAAAPQCGAAGGAEAQRIWQLPELHHLAVHDRVRRPSTSPPSSSSAPAWRTLLVCRRGRTNATAGHVLCAPFLPAPPPPAARARASACLHQGRVPIHLLPRRLHPPSAAT